MADWKSRLAVSYIDDKANTVLITPIDSFTPSFSLNTEVIHSIERTHVGVVYMPQNINFSLTVKAIGDVVADLTTIALQGRRFDLVLQETDDGSDWSFKKVVLSNCIITSATPSNATPSGAPTATFSGISLSASAEAKRDQPVRIP
jgi:hypothetical protein